MMYCFTSVVANRDTLLVLKPGFPQKNLDVVGCQHKLSSNSLSVDLLSVQEVTYIETQGDEPPREFILILILN